jgi:hypothetical protein
MKVTLILSILFLSTLVVNGQSSDIGLRARAEVFFDHSRPEERIGVRPAILQFSRIEIAILQV